MRRALGSNQRQVLSCSCPPSKETKDGQESRDTVLSSPSPTTHSNARLAGLHRDTRHFRRPDAQLCCRPGHSWTASTSAPTAVLTIEIKTPKPTSPQGHGEKRKGVSFLSPHLQTPRCFTSDPVNLPPPVTPSPSPLPSTPTDGQAYSRSTPHVRKSTDTDVRQNGRATEPSGGYFTSLNSLIFSLEIIATHPAELL